MLNARKNKIFTPVALGFAGLMALAGCGGGDDPTAPAGGGGTGQAGSENPGAAGGDLSGSIQGAGASSMQAAQQAWIANFQGVQPGLTVTYDAIGSGGGREQFLAGGTDFGGTDSPFSEDEYTQSQERCAGGTGINLPVYISPIAVIFNLEGVDSLNMSPELIAQIFNGDITMWNDPAIAAENPDATLPELAITPVHRSDGSGTTENFTDYLAQAAGDAWPHEVADSWPIPGGQSGDGTAGLVDVVSGAQGTIGYADASQAGDLGTVAIQVGGEYVEYSPEAAAAAVEASPRAEGHPENSVVIELDRTIDDPGTYPLVLIAYGMMCDTYDDGQGEAVKAYMNYIVSDQGQDVAAGSAGSAPLSDGLQEEVTGIIDAVETN